MAIHLPGREVVARAFLIDTASTRTILNATSLQTRASILGKPFEGGVTGIGGGRSAWHASGAKMKIAATSGSTRTRFIGPREILAVNGKRVYNILGTDALQEAGLQLHFDPRARTASLTD
ncbi:MAG: hypothetical protein ACYDDF_13730 [Thermoplasmatota archaeon]